MEEESLADPSVRAKPLCVCPAGGCAAEFCSCPGAPSKQYFAPAHRYAARQVRLQPRRPDFLLPFPESRELPQPGKGLETSTAFFQPTEADPLLSAPPSSGPSLSLFSGCGYSPCSFPKPGLLPPGSPWPHGPTGAAPELRPPSSFMLGTQRASLEAHSPGPPAAAPGKERAAVVAKAPLLVPEDFTRRRSPPLCGKAGTKQREAEIQQLEDELQLIGQKMQHYYNQQQELKSCQRQERLLCKWLELRGGVEEPTDAQEIREKLSQLKVQIGSLVSTLEGGRQLMQKYVNRVQDIRAALKT